MKEIVDLMDQGVDNGELLRLFLLYSLRYENDEKVKQLKEQLRSKVGGALEVATSLILYAGKAKRRGELFRTGFLAKPAQFLNSVFGEDIKNVFMQHKSKLAEIITDFSKGQLDKLAYPCFQGREHSGMVTQQNLLIFIVGGVTYQEAREADQFKVEQGPELNILLGGTSILTSASFLEDIAKSTATNALSMEIM